MQYNDSRELNYNITVTHMRFPHLLAGEFGAIFLMATALWRASLPFTSVSCSPRGLPASLTRVTSNLPVRAAVSPLSARPLWEERTTSLLVLRLRVEPRGSVPSPLRTVSVTTPDFMLCVVDMKSA